MSVSPATLTQAEFPVIHPVNDRTLLFTATAQPDLATQRRIWQLAAHLRGSCGDSLTDVVPGMGNLLLICSPGQQDLADRLRNELLSLWESSQELEVHGRQLTIPVLYGGEAGPDLQVVAAHTGLSPREIIERHSALDYPVYCLGFQPGFAYLGGLDPALRTPRRTRPRNVVEAGSIGIGGGQTGIYPSRSPGGWQIIGRTLEKIFDLGRNPPCLLQPGDSVRFVPVQ